jgi:hypothetical protein
MSLAEYRLFRVLRLQLRDSFHPSRLPLASIIIAVVPWRRRDGDASAVSRRAGSLSRDGNLRAGSGPPVLPPPTFTVRLLCVSLPLFFALVSVKRQFDDSKMYKKHKIKEITKTRP